MKGKGLSVTQQFGLAILEHADTQVREREGLDATKRALIAAASPQEALGVAQDLFPSQFGVSEQVVEEIGLRDPDLSAEGVDYDYSGVQWVGPEQMAPDELADLEQFFTDSVTVSQTENGEWV